MKSETFEITSIQDETPAMCAEAKELMATLGMEQAQEKAQTESPRFPYRLMTDEEQFVYSNICPQRTSLRQYSDPIPIEILKTAAYAKSLNDKRVDYLEIWHPETIRVKDPVLVGKESSWSSRCYILGRWGNELLPLEVLLPDAIRIWHSRRMDKLNEYYVQIQQALKLPMPLTMPRNVTDPALSL